MMALGMALVAVFQTCTILCKSPTMHDRPSARKLCGMNTHTPSIAKAMAPLKSGLLFLTLLAALLGVQAAHAAMQWKWLDAQGKIQYSDRPPPMDVPDKKILKRPHQSATVARPSIDSTLATTDTQKPLVVSTDPALEKKKQAQDAQEETQRKAEEAKHAQARASNCEKARKYDRALSQGYRVSRVNAKGEREFLDEKGLAEEASNTRQMMSSNCD